MRIRSRGVALLVIAFSACSSKSPAGNDGGNGDGGGSACSGTCPISTPTCGVYEACGQLVDCGVCAFGSSALPYASQSGFAASAPGGAIELAYVSQSDFTIHVARYSGGAWSDEVAVPRPPSGTLTTPVLALAPDGTRWLEYAVSGAPYITSAPEGGAWGSVALLPGEGPLVVGSDGTPWLAYYKPGGLQDVFIASPIGTVWTSTAIPVQTSNPPVLAISGSQPIAVVLADNGGPQLAQNSGSGWTVSTIPGVPAFFDGTVLLAADAEHVAVVTDQDDEIAAYVLTGTTWTTTALPQLTEDLLPDQLTLSSATYDAHGTLWLATGGNGNGAYLVNVTPDGAPTQRVLQKAGAVQVLPDAATGVALVSSQPVAVLTRAGAVSSASASACTNVVTSLCQSACTTCITGGRCSWSFATSGDTGNTYGSAVDCAFSLTVAMCGDADSADSALGACEAALPSTACSGPTADCTDACAILPSACDTVY